MCGPMLGIIGGVMSAAGSIVGAMGQSAALKAQAESAKAQAAFMKRQADAETIKGSTDILQQRRGVERILGSQTAGYGASGIQSDAGTTTDIAMTSQSEAEMDRQAIRFGRDLTASNYQYKAKIEEMNAKAYKQQAKFAMLSGFLGAGTSLVSSFPTA